MRLRLLEACANAQYTKRMIRTVTVLSIFVAVCSCCAVRHFSVEEEERSVLTVLVGSEADTKACDPLLVSTEPTDYYLQSEIEPEYVCQQFAGLPPETIDDFVAKSSSRHTWGELPRFASQQFVITPEEQMQYFGPDPMQFRRHHPQVCGVLVLAHVGFSLDGRFALAYRGWNADGGNGYLVAFERGVRGWREVKRLEVWVS